MFLIAGCAQPPGGGGGCDDPAGCEEAPPCAAAEDCEAGLACVAGRCADPPPGYCVGDADCTGGACDLTTNRCLLAVEMCGDAGACVGGAVCEEGRCVTRECEADDGCLGGRYCNGEGRCEPGCRMEGDCPMGQLCDPESRQCRPEQAAGDSAPDSAVEDMEVDASAPDGQVPDAGVDSRAPDAAPDAAEADVAPDMAEADVAPPVPVVPCEVDGDCGDEEACLIIEAPDGPGFVLGCGAALAEGRAEAECDSGLECASRTCVGRRFCFSACTADDECPSGTCRGFTVGEGEDRTQFLTCERPPDPCGADVDCAEAQMCLPVDAAEDQPNQARTVCLPALPGLAAGEACVRDGQCAGRECIPPGVCWGPCRVGEAGDCVDGQRCYENVLHFIFDQGTPEEADDRFWGLNGCLPDQGSDQPCADGRCPAGEGCRLYGNRTLDALDLRCRTAPGNLLGGALCLADDRCRSGVCLAQGFCLGVCDPGEPAGQCAAGSVCGVGVFTLWDRGTPGNPADDVTAEVSVCVR